MLKLVKLVESAELGPFICLKKGRLEVLGGSVAFGAAAHDPARAI